MVFAPPLLHIWKDLDINITHTCSSRCIGSYCNTVWMGQKCQGATCFLGADVMLHQSFVKPLIWLWTSIEMYFSLMWIKWFFTHNEKKKDLSLFANNFVKEFSGKTFVVLLKSFPFCASLPNSSVGGTLTLSVPGFFRWFSQLSEKWLHFSIYTSKQWKQLNK